MNLATASTCRQPRPPQTADQPSVSSPDCWRRASAAWYTALRGVPVISAHSRTAVFNGNSANNEFRLYEGFSQVDIGGLPMPLSFYGQYVKNNDAVTDQDTAWLLGAKSKVFGLNLDYNYRDVQRNAVVGAFTDSDFANGTTGSRGHKFKVGYEIDKNFSLGAAYLMAKTDLSQLPNSNADVDTLQVDLEAKF